MKKLVYVPDIFEADHVLELLSTEGIHAVKTSAASESIYGGKNQALSGYYIFVSEETESRAKDLLENLYPMKEAVNPAGKPEKTEKDKSFQEGEEMQDMEYTEGFGRKRKIVRFVIIVWSLLMFAVLLMGLFIF